MSGAKLHVNCHPAVTTRIVVTVSVSGKGVGVWVCAVHVHRILSASFQASSDPHCTARMSKASCMLHIHSCCCKSCMGAYNKCARFPLIVRCYKHPLKQLLSC